MDWQFLLVWTLPVECTWTVLGIPRTTCIPVGLHWDWIGTGTKQLAVVGWWTSPSGLLVESKLVPVVQSDSEWSPIGKVGECKNLSPSFNLPFPFPSGLPHVITSFPSCTFLQFLLPIISVGLLTLCCACRWTVVTQHGLLKMWLWLCQCASHCFEIFQLGGWHLLGIRHWEKL